jgi:pyruvate/2-oxoglutarate dehydrogenase complex dihydrolipoamide acyltransferase (E2) component
MKLKMLVLVLVALAWGAGTALAKGGPPPDKGPQHEQKDADKAQKDLDKDAAHATKDAEKGAAQATKEQDKATAQAAKQDEKVAAKSAKALTKAQAAAARAAVKELKFNRAMKRLGYSCRGGTTHVFATVVSVTPSTPGTPATETTPAVAPTPPTMLIEVLKGNSRGRLLVGSQTTITFSAGTEVIRRGNTVGIAGTIPAGSPIMIDLRLCTPPDTDPTDGVSPTPVLVARKIFARV